MENEKASTKNPKRALGIVYFSVFLDLLGFGIILPFLPYYAKHLGASGFDIGMILTSYSLAQFLGAAVLGRFSDRIGRRPILLLSLTGSTLAMIFSGLAGSILTLALARALAGLFGGSISTAQAYVADVTTPAERPKYMGLLGASIGTGFVVGPALGVGLNALGLGFAGAAFTAAVLNFINLILAVVRLPETRDPNVVRERGRWTEAIRRPGIRPILLAMFGTTFAFVSMETTFAYLGEALFGMNEHTFGLTLVWVGVVMIVVQGGLVGRLSKKMDVKYLAVGGGVLMGLALAVVPFSGSLVGAMLALGAFAAGQGFVSPSLSTLISRQSGDDQGTLLGAGQSFSAAARAVGPVAAGSLYDLQSFLPFVAGGGLALLAGLIVLSLAPHKNSAEQGEAS